MNKGVIRQWQTQALKVLFFKKKKTKISEKYNVWNIEHYLNGMRNLRLWIQCKFTLRVRIKTKTKLEVLVLFF